MSSPLDPRLQLITQVGMFHSLDVEGGVMQRNCELRWNRLQVLVGFENYINTSSINSPIFNETPKILLS